MSHYVGLLGKLLIWICLAKALESIAAAGHCLPQQSILAALGFLGANRSHLSAQLSFSIVVLDVTWRVF